MNFTAPKIQLIFPVIQCLAAVRTTSQPLSGYLPQLFCRKESEKGPEVIFGLADFFTRCSAKLFWSPTVPHTHEHLVRV